MYNIDHNDYSIVESNDADFYGVKIQKGKYKNVILIYGKVGIKEDQEMDTARLSFTYNIQDPAEFDSTVLEKDEYFKNYLGAVLQHIITDSLDEAKKNNKASIGIGHNESNTNTHPEPSSS
jgi:hypothetical protein